MISIGPIALLVGIFCSHRSPYGQSVLAAEN